MGKNFVPYNACTVLSGDCFTEGKCLRKCRTPQPRRPAAYKDPMAECFRRVRDACLMDDLSQAEKVAVLELVKAELLHDMLAAILPEREP